MILNRERKAIDLCIKNPNSYGLLVYLKYKRVREFFIRHSIELINSGCIINHMKSTVSFPNGACLYVSYCDSSYKFLSYCFRFVIFGNQLKKHDAELISSRVRE